MKAKSTAATGEASALVRKLWQYCNVLRDDGLSYPDYVEQLTYLLFLKMSDEQAGGPVPAEYAWGSLVDLDAEGMQAHYVRVLAALGERDGMLGLIFRNAKNKIKDPAKLRLLIVDLIGQTEWTGLSSDLKGDAYEGLLEKNARDTKSGAGQYFTPRPLIDVIVECVNPVLGEVVCDPACGTAGFLLAAHDYLKRTNPLMTRAQQKRLATKSIRGVELVEEVARLATMNLLLHGVGGNAESELPITCTDSLKHPPKFQADVVLTNPPFGVKGSVTYTQDQKGNRSDDSLTIVRADFWVQTANKQLNFLQHIVSQLKPGGRAAVVVPDNVLYEGGAGAVIRRRLLEECRLHTLLRLPAGLFYAQGVKANVLFFDRRRAQDKILPSEHLWIYELRTTKRYSLKTKPLLREDLDEFLSLYRSDSVRNGANSEPTPSGSASRSYRVADILLTEDCLWDMAWSDESGEKRQPGLARLDELSRLVAEDLQRALSLISNPRRP
ncbi:N-6 DNA methylase [Pseudoxanthomonas spadix BD-a59]|uniref:site-specific DNA-methyltransferase (adenine-specific) n=1 Tax=Pseudoxanthomonas spadix (strain BD-a59) TaxID=1045855 RepID=G7UNM6_PSEUP|nr:class I SAM-dependent DNA methyltransferase [Pseudoxanthomonas spadix]AER56650.1 N-6 DNA methylase [Pseudoxanthomonas spadix BD-a59]